MANNRLRRFLRRLAERKGISYKEAAEYHLGTEIDKNILFSLNRRRNKGSKRKRKKREQK